MPREPPGDGSADGVGLVFGGVVPGLSDALADRLRLSVQQANPLTNLTIRDGALDSLVTDEVASLLMLPIGLAMRQVA